MASFTDPQIVPNMYDFFLLLIIEDILKNVGNQTVVGPPLTTIVREKILWMSTETKICLVTHVLQNIFCVQPRKETHTSLKPLEGG